MVTSETTSMLAVHPALPTLRAAWLLGAPGVLP